MMMRWRAMNLSLDGSFDKFNFSDDYDDDAKHFFRMFFENLIMVIVGDCVYID